MNLVYKKYDFVAREFDDNSSNSTIQNKYIYEEYEFENNHDQKIAIISFSVIVSLILLHRSGFWTMTSTKWLRDRLHIFLAISSLVLSIFVVPLLLGVLLIFFVYRQMVHLYLKRKYGPTYKGLLNGTDIIWSLEEDYSKSIINALAIVEYDRRKGDADLTTKLQQNFRELFFENRENYPKMLHIRRKRLGFHFWMESDLRVEDCVRTWDEVESEGELELNEIQKYLSEKSNAPLPKNNMASWDILVSSQPVLWRKTRENETNTSNQYPIILRVHHSVGDGVSLLKLLLGAIADENCTNIANKSTPSSEKFPKTNFSLSFTGIQMEKFFLKLDKQFFVHVFGKGLGKILKFYEKLSNTFKLLMRSKDKSVLHGSKLTGEKILVWAVDDSTESFETVKRIKRRCKDVRFSDVLLTAISASFAEHYYKFCTEIPDCITAVIPAVSGLTELAHFIPNKITKSKKIVLQNSFSVGMLTLPIDFAEIQVAPEENILQRLRQVKMNTDLLRNSVDYKVNYWLLSLISSALPEILLKPILYSTHCTLVISSLPGPPELTVCGGQRLNDIVFWIPHRGTTGIGVSVLTYGNRLQVGLMVDKALIPYISDAQNIVDSVPRYLKILDCASFAIRS